MTRLKEIRSDNPEIRKIGPKDWLALLLPRRKTGLIAYGGSAAGAGLMGVAGALNPGATEIENRERTSGCIYLSGLKTATFMLVAS